MPLRFVRHYYRTTQDFSRNAKLYLASTFLSGMGFSIFGVIFNLYLTAGGFREQFIGNMLAVGTLTLALCALPGGVLSDRVGRRTCLLIGGGFTSLSVLLRALTLEPRLLLSLAVAGGISLSFMMVSNAPFLMENSTPEERTHLFSVQFSTGLVAAMLGNLVGGKMPEWFAGLAPGLSQLVYFRWTLLAGACLSFFGLIPLLAVREPPARVPQQRGRLAPFRNREEFGAVGGFLLNSALIGMGAGLVVPFFNLYFAKRFECSSAQIGFFFSGAQVTMAVAVLAAPFLARRWGKVQAIVFTEAASLPFLLSLSVERYLPFAVAAFWLRSAFMNMGGPISSSFMMELVPEDRRATASSLVGMSWNLTWAFSASASGWIMQRYGYSIPFFITAFLYALAAVTFFVMFREREAQQGRQGKG